MSFFIQDNNPKKGSNCTFPFIQNQNIPTSAKTKWASSLLTNLANNQDGINNLKKRNGSNLSNNPTQTGISNNSQTKLQIIITR